MSTASFSLNESVFYSKTPIGPFSTDNYQHAIILKVQELGHYAGSRYGYDIKFKNGDILHCIEERYLEKIILQRSKEQAYRDAYDSGVVLSYKIGKEILVRFWNFPWAIYSSPKEPEFDNPEFVWRIR